MVGNKNCSFSYRWFAADGGCEEVQFLATACLLIFLHPQVAVHLRFKQVVATALPPDVRHGFALP